MCIRAGGCRPRATSLCHPIGPGVAIDSGAPDRAGWLRFGRPGIPTDPALGPDHFVRPEPGLLALFPANVWHGVEPFASDLAPADRCVRRAADLAGNGGPRTRRVASERRLPGGSDSPQADCRRLAVINYLIRMRFWVGLRPPATKQINGLQRCRPFLFLVGVTPGLRGNQFGTR